MDPRHVPFTVPMEPANRVLSHFYKPTYKPTRTRTSTRIRQRSRRPRLPTPDFDRLLQRISSRGIFVRIV